MQNPYIRCFHTVVKHRWYVMRECMKEGLVFRGLVHDLSKLSFAEFGPYSRRFYTGAGNSGDADILRAFDKAWLHHVQHNRHHWEHWVTFDGGAVYPAAMDRGSVLEMLCDWTGSAKAYGGYDGSLEDHSRSWYVEHGAYMILHPDTRQLIEDYLGVTPEDRLLIRAEMRVRPGAVETRVH